MYSQHSSLFNASNGTLWLLVWADLGAQSDVIEVRPSLSSTYLSSP